MISIVIFFSKNLFYIHSFVIYNAYKVILFSLKAKPFKLDPGLISEETAVSTQNRRAVSEKAI